MANRRLRIATSLTGLLVVANSGLLPGDADGGLISAAYAQDSESWDEEGENAGDDSEFTDEDDAAESDDTIGEDEAEELDDDSEDAGDEDEGVDEDEEESSDEGTEVAGDDSPSAEPADAPKPVDQPLAAQENPKPAAVSGSDQVRASTRTFLARFFQGHAVGDDEDFFQLGFVNSLLAMQLVAFCEKEFGIQVEDEDLDIGNFRTINNIAALVARKRQ